jgi:hypothetical protein
MCRLWFSNSIKISGGARISVQEVECFVTFLKIVQSRIFFRKFSILILFAILRHLCSEDTSKGYQIEIYEDKWIEWSSFNFDKGSLTTYIMKHKRNMYRTGVGVCEKASEYDGSPPTTSSTLIHPDNYWDIHTYPNSRKAYI